MEDRKRYRLVAILAAVSAILAFSAAAMPYFRGSDLDVGMIGAGLFMTVVAVASLRQSRSPGPSGTMKTGGNKPYQR